ncbi:hypothetical protein Bca101_077169 [Brassica carinata]
MKTTSSRNKQTIFNKENSSKSNNPRTAGTLAKNQPSTRRVSEEVANTTHTRPNILEPTVHGTKPEPKRLTRNSTKRRDQHQKLKPPPPAKPSSEGLKPQPPYTASPEATEGRANQTNNRNKLIKRSREGLL